MTMIVILPGVLSFSSYSQAIAEFILQILGNQGFNPSEALAHECMPCALST